MHFDNNVSICIFDNNFTFFKIKVLNSTTYGIKKIKISSIFHIYPGIWIDCSDIKNNKCNNSGNFKKFKLLIHFGQVFLLIAYISSIYKNGEIEANSLK
jgi:hypothetical protein